MIHEFLKIKKNLCIFMFFWSKIKDFIQLSEWPNASTTPSPQLEETLIPNLPIL